MDYRSEIDGLRAIAVIPVILFHAGFDSFSGGFVGVDIFFVISGYLITNIILSEKEQGKFSIINFYERRARRILPALFFVMFLCLPLAWFSLLPRDLKGFSQSLAAVSLFSSNFLFWLESGYFATASELKPLLHTWSLAVEEQYYVFYPLYLMLVWKYRKRWIFGSIIILGLISISIAEYWSTYMPDAAFFLLPTRAWELMIGATAGYFHFYGCSHEKLSNRNKYLSEALGFLGFAFIAFSVFIYDKNIPFPSIYALLPTLGTVLIILFSSSKTFLGRLLSKKIFVGIGLISYSAYLWHQPLLVFSRHYNGGEPEKWLISIIILATFFLAYFSWQFVEKPFRSKSTFGRKSIFVYSIMGTILFLIVGFFGHITSGYEKQFVKYRLTTDQKNNYQIVKQSIDYDSYNNMFDNHDCKFWNKSVQGKTIERYIKCFEKYGKGVIVLGDSHGMNMFNIVAKSDYRPFIVGISQGGCRPQNNKPSCHYDDFDDFVSKYKDKIDYILFHQSGSYFVKDSNGNFDSSLAFEDNQKYEFSHDAVEALLNYLYKLKQYVPTVWIGPFVEARVELASKRLINGHFQLNSNSVKIFRQLEPFIINKIKSSQTLELDEYLSFNSNILIEENFLRVSDCVTYRDIDHFSYCGEDLLALEMGPLLLQLDKYIQLTQ